MADSPIPSSTQQKLDDLSKYAENVPGYADEAKKQIDDAGLGDTEFGKAAKAGLEGASAGLATGAGVGATVAGTAVTLGILTTGAVALQAIPIAGTIAGAVMGLVAGLVAFFTGKSKALMQEKLKLSDLLVATSQKILDAINVLPDNGLRDAAKKLYTDNWNSVKLPFGQTPTKEQLQRQIDLLNSVPKQLQALIIDWAKQHPQPQTDYSNLLVTPASPILTTRRIGYAIVGTGLLGGLYYAYRRKMI